MAIAVTFNPPSPSDTPEVFNTKAFATLGDLNTWSTQANSLATAVSASESAAAASASTAGTSASTATTKASEASASATAAAGSATGASGSATSASNSFTAMDIRYLGAKTADPSTNNTGGALAAGALYWNTTSNLMRVYNGSAWQNTAATATSVTASQISDSTATGRSVLTAADAAAARTAIGAGTGNGNGDVTLAGTQTLSNKTLSAPVVTDYTETTYSANTGSAYTISLSNGTVQKLTLTANCTYTFPTPVAGKSFLLKQMQDATGSRTATWPATVKWPGGTAPTITATASKGDKFFFHCLDGAYWEGSVGGQAYA